MSKLKAVNPKQGEIVNLKFKSINKLMQEGCNATTSFHDVEDYYCLQDNVKAYISGGHFLVEAALTEEEDYKDDPYIEVKNHLDHTHTFVVHESALESVEQVDAAEVFVSHDLKIIAVRVDHEMFINGEPLIWDEKVSAKNDDTYQNHNRKFIRMFENFITDLAVRDTFEHTEEEG